MQNPKPLNPRNHLQRIHVFSFDAEGGGGRLARSHSLYDASRNVAQQRNVRTSRQPRGGEGAADAFRKGNCGSKCGALDGQGQAVLRACVDGFFVSHAPPHSIFAVALVVQLRALLRQGNINRHARTCLHRSSNASCSRAFIARTHRVTVTLLAKDTSAAARIAAAASTNSGLPGCRSARRAS